MPQYTIDQLEALAAIEQGGRPETFQNDSGLRTFRTPPVRSDIRQQAYAVLCLKNDWMSRAEVAKALGLKKTGWLNQALDWLATEGYVEKCAVHGGGQLPTFFYAARRQE